jgi:hypothetical protein
MSCKIVLPPQRGHEVVRDADPRLFEAACHLPARPMDEPVFAGGDWRVNAKDVARDLDRNFRGRPVDTRSLKPSIPLCTYRAIHLYTVGFVAHTIRGISRIECPSVPGTQSAPVSTLIRHNHRSEAGTQTDAILDRNFHNDSMPLARRGRKTFNHAALGC